MNAMTREEITDKLREIMIYADESRRDAVNAATESTTLRGDLGFSSVNMLYMVIAIEESFGIRFDDVNVSDFSTLGDTVGYIEKMLK